MARRNTRRKGFPQKRKASEVISDEDNDNNVQETSSKSQDAVVSRNRAPTPEKTINLEASSTRQEVVTDPDPVSMAADNLDLGFSLTEDSENDDDVKDKVKHKHGGDRSLSEKKGKERTTPLLRKTS